MLLFQVLQGLLDLPVKDLLGLLWERLLELLFQVLQNLHDGQVKLELARERVK